MCRATRERRMGRGDVEHRDSGCGRESRWEFTSTCLREAQLWCAPTAPPYPPPPRLPTQYRPCIPSPRSHFHRPLAWGTLGTRLAFAPTPETSALDCAVFTVTTSVHGVRIDCPMHTPHSPAPRVRPTPAVACRKSSRRCTTSRGSAARAAAFPYERVTCRVRPFGTHAPFLAWYVVPRRAWFDLPFVAHHIWRCV